jgi:hypothetical protein
MIRRVFFVFFFILFTLSFCGAQAFIKTADLFKKGTSISNAGELNIIQDPGVDTLVSRILIANQLLGGGMEGFRIQIYRSSTRTAREEANKENAKFMVDFPDIPSVVSYEKPGYFLVRVGNFRTKLESTRSLYLIRKKYPNAYPVPDIIIYPDLKKN